jgi:hypothetical protein
MAFDRPPAGADPGIGLIGALRHVVVEHRSEGVEPSPRSDIFEFLHHCGCLKAVDNASSPPMPE